MFRSWNEASHRNYACLLMFMVSSFIGHKFAEVVVPSKLLPDNNIIGYISHAFISTGSNNVIIMIINTNVVIVVVLPVIHRHKPLHDKPCYQGYQPVQIQFRTV